MRLWRLIFAAVAASLLLGAGYDARAQRTRYFLEDCGVVVDDGTDDLAAIQSCVAAHPGAADFTLRSPGVVDVAQSSLGDVIKLGPNQRLIGGGASIRNTGICCPVVVLADADNAQVIGWKFVHHAGRTDAWTNSNCRLQVQQGVIPGDGQAESTWFGRSYATAAILENRGESDLGALVYIGNSPGAVVQSCQFTSDTTDERWFNRTAIYIDVNEDMSPAENITVDDCDFTNCIQGVLTCQLKRATLTNLRGHQYWNIGPNASSTAGHVVYVTGGASAANPIAIGSDNLVSDVTDLGSSYVNTGGTAANDFYYEPSVKLRNQLRLTVTRVFSRRQGGGLDLFSLKDCDVSHVFIDQRTQVGNGSTNAQAVGGLRIDRNSTNYPPGYSVADFGGNRFDDITLYAVPDTVDMGDAWVNDASIGGYDGTTPLDKSDTWTRLRLYLHLANPTSANKQPIRLIGDGSTFGTASAPVYVGRVSTGTNWPSDFQTLSFHFYCKNTTVNAAVDAPGGSFTAGHGPRIVANGSSGTGNSLNGSGISPGGSVEFEGAVSAPG